MNIVYVQMNSTLPVFLRDVHNTPPSTYGTILSINAGMVVLFQFWLTRKISNIPPMVIMALGTLFLLIGFGLYGFVSGFLMFALAMVIITIGEMIIMPVAQALVAKFAPEDMRGRYMAVYGTAWTIPFAVGPYLAGLIMENFIPNWVWYASMILCILAIMGFLRMHLSVGKTLGNPLQEQEIGAE
jgi:MFS family permease